MKKHITISVILLFFSCASRKVNKHHEQLEILKTEQLESADIIKQETVTHIDTHIDIITINDEYIITPIDNTKPMTIAGKVFINAAITAKKNQNQKKEAIKQQEIHNAQTTSHAKQQSETKLLSAIKNKDTDRQANYWFWLLLLIPIFVFSYQIYKKK